MYRLILPLVFTANVVFAQSYNASQDSALISRLKYHVYCLADDSLEGRGTATEGEKKAYRYISKKFKEMELSLVGENESYLHPFGYTEGRIVNECSLTLFENNPSNKRCCDADSDYYPLAYSSSRSLTAKCVDAGFGITAKSLGYDDYAGMKNLKGKIFFINISTPEGVNPHSRYSDFLDLRARVEKAVEKGASAVIFYGKEDSIASPEQMLDKNIYPTTVPVVFLKEQPEAQDKNLLSAKIKVGITPINKTGHNVVGKIDNGAKTTVVIGAHYDHLGYGGEGSLYRGEKSIHNGADDNASGVALIMELARQLKNSDLKNNNYIFIAFSGEELGLYGSKQFVSYLGDEIKNINYMLNFDMVGRLGAMERNLNINGFGSSPAFNALLNIPSDSIRIKTTDSGIGPSDHTSFYLKDIPVLHFFTGAHEDYHKPSDDAGFVNYSGITSILKLACSLIDSLDHKGKIAFTAVAADTSHSTPKFKVTLGVIPDYMFAGEGMRIDGVTEGKPASLAGLQKGDTVIQLGEHKVSDMMSYMKALSYFNKGNTTTVVVLREQKNLEFKVTF